MSVFDENAITHDYLIESGFVDVGAFYQKVIRNKYNNRIEFAYYLISPSKSILSRKQNDLIINIRDWDEVYKVEEYKYNVTDTIELETIINKHRNEFIR